MMHGKSRDVILIARPDHSYFIYSSLLKSKLSFLYITFKQCPEWIAKLLGVKRAKIVSNNYSVSFWMTLHNLALYRYGMKWASRFSGGKIFTRHIKSVMASENPKLIHYWPDYCKEYIFDFKKKHPEVKTLADIYFPCAEVIINEMYPVLNKYGLKGSIPFLEKKIDSDKRLMEIEDNFIVPSTFIAESYRKLYPNKVFIIVSYGIPKWVGYKKKNLPPKVFKFVYVGTISIEKGCDILCEWFSKHPEYEIHLIGKIRQEESVAFNCYAHKPNIYFDGVIAHNTIHNVLSSYDVGIHLSRYDAYSLAVAEEIAAGLPVIVSENTGIKDDVSKYDVGIVTSLNDADITQSIDTVTKYYGRYLDAIDKYYNNCVYSYGDEIVALYEYLLN